MNEAVKVVGVVVRNLYLWGLLMRGGGGVIKAVICQQVGPLHGGMFGNTGSHVGVNHS
jgi:hypothetical protein